MKILGQLLVWCSLAVGVLSAATAYVASLDAADDRLLGLTMILPAEKGDQAKREPKADKGGGQGDKNQSGKTEKKKPAKRKKTQAKPVTRELLAELRRAGAGNIRVKEFSFSRWRGRWYFVLSLIGLLVGAGLTRLGTKTAPVAEAGEEAAGSPERTLEAMQREIETLRSELPAITAHPLRLKAIVDRLGRLQTTHMMAFVDARPELTSKLGLAGYAGLMDSYAAAERQINRAWSAAADGVYEEATACLDEASTLLAHTRQRLSEARGADTIDRPKAGD